MKKILEESIQHTQPEDGCVMLPNGECNGGLNCIHLNPEPKEIVVATEMPDTGEMSTQMLVDSLGEFRETIKSLQKQEGYFKEAIKARAAKEELEVLEGTTYRVVVSHKTQNRIDTEGLKSEFGLAWYEGHCKTIEFDQVNVDRKKE